MSPNQEILDVLARAGLRTFTSRTVTSLSKLVEEVEQVRKQGYAVDYKENEDGVNCIGAPVGIFGRDRVAVSVSGPATRFGSRRIPELAALVVETAHAISASLGTTAIIEKSGQR